MNKNIFKKLTVLTTTAIVVDTHKKFPHILIEKRTICTVVQI